MEVTKEVGGTLQSNNYTRRGILCRATGLGTTGVNCAISRALKRSKGFRSDSLVSNLDVVSN